MNIYGTNLAPHNSDNFKPTCLYIKQHNITKLKYFGMTTKKYVNSYRGSGSYWKLHLKEHGADISTIWFQWFTSLPELTDFAQKFSIEHDIANSDQWGNLVPETGLYGNSGPNKGQPGRIWTDEEKQKLSAIKKANPSRSMLGRHHSEVSKSKCSATLTGRTRPNITPGAKKWKLTNVDTQESKIIDNLQKWCVTNQKSYKAMWASLKRGKPYQQFTAIQI